MLWRIGLAIETGFTKRLELKYPIIQAPMAGGGDTPELVAEVCNAGALGTIGAAYLTPEQIAKTAKDVRERTGQPFGINLFAPLPAPEAPADASSILRRVSPFFAEVGLPVPVALPQTAGIPFQEQLQASVETGASVFSFAFGLIPPEAVQEVRRRKLYLMGTANTVAEALALQSAGVDAVIMQGSEAGGHRGCIGIDFEQSMVGTIALVPQAVDALKISVIASGGIMDGRGVAAALALGATAVQMGTAFLTCTEAGVSEAYKEAILCAHEDQTRLTRAFSGRPARGIINRFMTEVEIKGRASDILPFPIQNALTRPLRSAASKQGRAEFLSLWAGQGVRMARKQSAAELVERLGKELEAALARLSTTA